ncbi:MAG: hypothetical protein GY850_18825 [bacterium]|nr:hypothetical protein [bacterium]
MKTNTKRVIYWLLAATVLMGIPGHAWADPTCSVEVQDPGPPKIVHFIFQESQVGLKEVTIKNYGNARITIQPFVPPNKNPVVVSVTQKNINLDFFAVIEAKDMNNQTTTCRYPGEDPPECSVIGEDPGPPFTVSLSIQDATEGLESITLDSAVNADVNIPSFSVGTTDAVIVTASQKDEFADLAVSLTATDVNQNQNTCTYNQQAQNDTQDPEVVLTTLDPGPPTQLEITAQDRESGIDAINIVEALNADVQIPAFTVGTTEPVVISAGQTIEIQPFKVEIEVADRAGNKTTYLYEIADRQLRPEIDLAGDDSQYFFRDEWISQIILKGKDAFGKSINDFSAFQSERFSTNAGQSSVDSCYSLPSRPYLSMLTPTWTEADYEWEIVLQMKPSTDLVLKLHGCVLKTGADDVWTAGYQSGFYTLPWAPNQPVFVSTVNPRLSVRALPGPMAKESFPAAGFILDTRRHAGLQVAPLADSLITIQTLAGESIVIALPTEGDVNASGQTMYALSPGDRIKVQIHIPDNTPSDVRFGADSAMVQYIGLKGTEYLTGP